MPEGDTAYRAAHHLARALAGRTLIRSELRVPRYATVQLAGTTVGGAQSRGKHILLRAGDWTIHSHLGMDGSWLLVPPPRSAGGASRTGTRGRRPWPDRHRIRARLDTDAVVALGVDLARLRAWPTAQEPEMLGWLGPDLLDAAPDLDEARRRILAEPERPITAALLDQANVAGLGNEYVTEMCFLRGLLPNTTVADAGDIGEWLELGRDLMLANRDRVERTFTGNRLPGQTTYVFARGGKPCRRCGTTVLQGKHASGVRRAGGGTSGAGTVGVRMRSDDDLVDGAGPGGLRESAWCPHCQR